MNWRNRLLRIEKAFKLGVSYQFYVFADFWADGVNLQISRDSFWLSKRQAQKLSKLIQEHFSEATDENRAREIREEK